jgi:hypothetical protein
MNAGLISMTKRGFEPSNAAVNATLNRTGPVPHGRDSVLYSRSQGGNVADDFTAGFTSFNRERCRPGADATLIRTSVGNIVTGPSTRPSAVELRGIRVLPSQIQAMPV